MARRFLLIYGLTTTFFTGLLGLLNYVIDPYDMNGRFACFPHKPEVAGHERIAKAFAVLRHRPQELILGTSRAEYGLTVDHPGWRAPTEKRMNAAIAGATLYESALYLEQAAAAGELRRAVMGLDFFAFNAYQRSAKGLHEGVFLRGTAPWNRLAHAIPLYLSADTLRSSLVTVRHGFSPAPLAATAPADAEFTFDASLLGHGQRALFTNSERYFLKYAFFPHPYRKFALRAPAMPSQLDDFARMLALARAHEVELKLFISPVHARQLETIRAAGLWPDFEAWKRELVRMLAADAAAHPGAPAFPLWDFSGFGTVQSESVPSASDTVKKMRWYRESSHYSKASGAWVLARVLQTGAPEAPADFGVALTSTNIDAHLAKTRQDRDRWAAAHRDDEREIEGLAHEVRAAR